MKIHGVRTRGFTARKNEIKNIKETGSAVIKRSKKGLVPSIDNCPLGNVGDIVWFREHLQMQGKNANLFAVIDAVTVENVKENVLGWVVSVTKSEKPTNKDSE